MATPSPGVVVCAFNPSTLEVEGGISLEFKASLVYRVKSYTEKPYLEKQTKPKNY